MSVVMTYDSLVLNVQQFMERNDPDFVAQIPNLIALAESNIAAELKSYLQLIVVETTLAQNQTVFPAIPETEPCRSGTSCNKFPYP